MDEIIKKINECENIEIENKEDYLRMIISQSSFIHVEKDSIKLKSVKYTNIYHYTKNNFINRLRSFYVKDDYTLTLEMEDPIKNKEIVFQLNNAKKINEIYNSEKKFEDKSERTVLSLFCVDLITLIERKFIELENNNKKNINF